MRKISFIFLLVLSLQGLSQGITYLPTNINHKSKNNIYPALSGDGKTMLFSSDYTKDDELGLMISAYVGGRWQDPKEVEAIGPSRINNIGGYSLNNDGKTIWFSSKRADGVGGFDVWYSNKTSSGWSRPANPGKPLNSEGHDGNPSISPDGERLYFMRCKKMSRSGSEGCKIFYSDKNHSPGRPWKDPVELPANLNLGNTVSPRIFSDNRTMVFSSDRPGGKGKLDVWMTRKDDENWSDPVNVGFVNSDINDQFISVSLRNDIAFFTKKDERGFGSVVQSPLPRDFRPDNVVMIMGHINDVNGDPLTAEVRINDYEAGKLVSYVVSNAKDGSYTAVLPAGCLYEVSYSERSGTKTFISDIIDTRELRGSRRTYPTIVIQEVRSGMTLPMNAVSFEPFSTRIDARSNGEILRLVRLLKKNPELNIEIEVYQKEYMQDTLPSEDLTELQVDTVITYDTRIRVDTLTNASKDSLLSEINDTLMYSINDTTIVNNYLARMAGIDSVEVVSLQHIYSNYRAELQAERIKKVLVEKGITEDRVVTAGFKEIDPPTPFMSDTNRMVFVKFQ